MHVCVLIKLLLPEVFEFLRRDRSNKGNDVRYLQQQDELRESLNGLHHQAVQRDPIDTRRLLLLETDKGETRFSSWRGWIRFFSQRDHEQQTAALTLRGASQNRLRTRIRCERGWIRYECLARSAMREWMRWFKRKSFLMYDCGRRSGEKFAVCVTIRWSLYYIDTFNKQSMEGHVRDGSHEKRRKICCWCFRHVASSVTI